MSMYAGARSHTSQVAAAHKSRIAAGNASRLAAAGLALFLTFGFAGAAQAGSNQQPNANASDSAGKPADLPETPAPAKPADQGAAEQPGGSATDTPDTDVIEISAVSTDAPTATMTVTAMATGASEVPTSAVAPQPTDGATVARIAQAPANPPANQGGANQGGGQGSDTSGEYVATPVCHKNGVIIVIDDDGLNGHGAGREGHAGDQYDELDGLEECADTDGDDVVDVIDEDDDSDGVPDLDDSAPLDPVVSDIVEGDEKDDETENDGTEGDGTEGDGTEGDGTEGDGTVGGDKKGSDGNGSQDRPSPVTPSTGEGDTVESPDRPQGGWRDPSRNGDKSPDVILGEELERPRGSKTPLGGKVPAQGKAARPGTSAGRPNDNGTLLPDQIVGGARKPATNRPAALVLPQTGAAENMAIQAGAGLILVVAGGLTLLGRRRESDR